MMKALINLLEITDGSLDGLRSMNNLSPDQRQALNADRARSIESICIKIRVYVYKYLHNTSYVQESILCLHYFPFLDKCLQDFANFFFFEIT